MSEDIQEKHFNNQPFFVVTDDAYERMYKSLKSGQTSVKTYLNVCPHKVEAKCKCPSFNNILINDRICRIYNNQTKMVYKISEYL